MDCMLCEEPITNPLCPSCLGVAVEQWLLEVNEDKVLGLNALTATHVTHNGEKCIKCKDNFSVCTYCYTKDIFNWLRDGTEQLQFLRIFNFL